MLTRRPLLTALLLVAFGMRALVPAGFMPGPGGLVICPAGMAAAMPDSHGMSHHMAGMHEAQHAGHAEDSRPSTTHSASEFCAFAAAAAVMAGGYTCFTVAIVEHIDQRLDPSYQPFVPRGTIVPTRLPRGPPLLA